MPFPPLAQAAYRAHSEYLLYPIVKKLLTGHGKSVRMLGIGVRDRGHAAPDEASSMNSPENDHPPPRWRATRQARMIRMIAERVHGMHAQKEQDRRSFSDHWW